MVMAESRINRRNQHIMLYKGSQDNPAIPEEEDEGETDDGRMNRGFVQKTKDATVEVTVKVKKRRNKSGESGRKPALPREKEYRKGSWGDLLSSSRTSLAHVPPKTERGNKEVYKEKTSPGSGGDGKSDKKKDEHSPLCQKIPITDDLYLETHTHIRKSQSADADVKCGSGGKSKTAVNLRQRALMRENEDLRDQVDRLLKEIEVTKRKPRTSRYRKSVEVQVQADEKERTPKKSAKATQSKQTSTTCLMSTSPRKLNQTQTIDVGDLKTPRKKSASVGVGTVSTSSTTTPPSTESAAAQLENLRLEKENDALRSEAGKLLEDMHRARVEYLECCNTMKELHSIAEILKRDNFSLLQKNQHQQTLEGKLIEALAENREMKDILESIVDKHKSDHGIQDDQLSQIRNVIRDVKLTIAQEMKGLSTHPSQSFCVEKDNADSDVGFKIGESFMNDTNASEIQRILGEPPEIRRGNSQEDRSSSTQYLTLGGLPGMDGLFRPSPVAFSKYSPRVSTPNSSSISLNLSEAGFNPVQPVANTSIEDNEWKRLEAEVARSFIPVQNELSNCSSSSYSSMSNSPNPLRK